MTELDYQGTFTQAIQDASIHAGDRILLKGGTYSGDFSCNLNGGDGITVMAYPGERAIVDGSLVVGGTNITWQNVEICYSGWTTRETETAGSNPPDIPTTKNLTMGGTGNKLINCIIHDLASPASMEAAYGAELYGCIIFHHGWHGPDRGHGHGIYVQNNTPTKTLKDCIIFDCFGWGIHAYTESGNINNITLDGCTCFGAGSLNSSNYNNILAGGYQVANSLLVQNCMTYGSGGVNIGYDAGAVGSLLNNYFADGITKVNATLTEEGNYYGPAVGNQVFLRANTYDANRANLTIFNQAEADTIEVDVSAIFGASGTVKAYNVQDYFVDIQTLTITAGVITVNMQAINRTVATPVQGTAPATTFPTFGAFVLIKQ